MQTLSSGESRGNETTNHMLCDLMITGASQQPDNKLVRRAFPGGGEMCHRGGSPNSRTQRRRTIKVVNLSRFFFLLFLRRGNDGSDLLLLFCTPTFVGLRKRQTRGWAATSTLGFLILLLFRLEFMRLRSSPSCNVIITAACWWHAAEDTGRPQRPMRSHGNPRGESTAADRGHRRKKIRLTTINSRGDARDHPRGDPPEDDGGLPL